MFFRKALFYILSMNNLRFKLVKVTVLLEEQIEEHWLSENPLN